MIDICESSGFLQALLIIKKLFTAVCLIVPLILIFTMSMDVYKLISNPDDKKKVFPVIKKRLIAAFIILFIPTILRVTMKAMKNYNDFSTCWNNAESEKIEAIKEQEKREANSKNNNNTTNNLNQNETQNGHWGGTTVDENGGSHHSGNF